MSRVMRRWPVATRGRDNRAFRLCFVLGLPVAVSACSRGGDAPPPSLSMKPPAVTRPAYTRNGEAYSPYAGARSKLASGYKLGQPYRIANVWYVPREEPGFDRTGTASWYGADFHGRLTANGETYNMNALTAAHPTLPLPSYVTVTNLANNRTVLVRINDRGPYVDGRLIDLSRAAARALGYETSGTASVRVRYAGRAPLNGDDTRERQYLASQPWAGSQTASAISPERVPRPQETTSGWSSLWGVGGER